MATNTFVCAHCNATARSSKPIPPGAMIKCPKCGVVSRVADAPLAAPPQPPDAVSEVEPVDTPTATRNADSRGETRRASRPAPVDGDRPRRRSRDDYDRDEFDGPRPRRKPRSAGGSRNNPVAVIAAAAALVLIVAGIILIGVFVWNSSRNKSNAQVAEPVNPFGMPPLLEPVSWSPNFRSWNDAPRVEAPEQGEAAKSSAAVDTRRMVHPLRLRPAPSTRGAESEQLDAEILAKVKRATVYIRVTRSDGISSGSGFFATGAEGMVLTNAHVVHMLDPGAAPPEKIEVILYSGESDEMVFRGEVLTVDRHSDLAVLRIHKQPEAKSANLPQPLGIAADAPLRETQQVYVFGFPLGEQLGKNITVAKSSITSLRKSAEGELDQIQVGGGMHPGNSGGPVVDSAGNVVGVAVAVIRGTSINFAIPAERVQSIISGRLFEMRMHDPVQKDGQLILSIKAESLDPLGQMKDVMLDWWWGQSTANVPPTRAAAPAGGAARQSIVMKKSAAQRYVADIVLSLEPPQGKVLWLQTHFTDGTNTKIFNKGFVKEIDPPPQPKPIRIVYRPPSNSSQITLKCTNDLNIRTAQGEGGSLFLSLECDLSETTQANAPQRGTGLHLTHNKFAATFRMNGKSIPSPPQIETALKNANLMSIDLVVDDYGNIFRATPSVENVPSDSQYVLGRFAIQVARMLDFASLVFPNSELHPGQRWRGVRQPPLLTMDDISEVADVEFTYRGIRRLDGRELAVISLSGSLKNQSTAKPPDNGIAGTILVDVESGLVTKANATIIAPFTLRAVMQGLEHQSVSAHGRIEVMLTRK